MSDCRIIWCKEVAATANDYKALAHPEYTTFADCLRYALWSHSYHSEITTTDGLTTVSKAFRRCELVKVKSAKRKIRRPVTA